MGDLLKKNKLTIGTIESCSGGYIANKITSVPGSSAYYKGSLLTYAYETKADIADIAPKELLKYGAVSHEICEQMTRNAQRKLNVDYCIATTGIAGPTGETKDKPVGLVYIGLAKPDGTIEINKCQFYGTREQVIERTANAALDMVRKSLP